MVPHVLGVGYAYNEYEVTAGRWKEFEIEFDYADNIKQAAAMLSFKEYICVAICSDVIPQDDLDILRQKRAVPIIVVPPSYSEEQRYACVHFGAAQYLHTYNHPMVEMFSEKNSMRNCLKIPKDKRRPLTIITVKDLSFCLEYERKMYRYKAQYSLDCENGIENAVLRKLETPEMLLEEKQLREQIYSAVMALPEKQAKRIYARYYLGMSVNEIAGAEGVDPSRVRDSIRRGLKQLAKIF